MPIGRASGPVGSASVPVGGAVAAHLARMHARRVALFGALVGVPEERLWARAAPRKWSPGEHLDHRRVLNGAFRRLLMVAWLVVSPWPTLLPGGRSRLERSYATEIDDVCRRPNVPKWVGFLWPPRRTPSRPALPAGLERVLAEEHAAIERRSGEVGVLHVGRLAVLLRGRRVEGFRERAAGATAGARDGAGDRQRRAGERAQGVNPARPVAVP